MIRERELKRQYEEQRQGMRERTIKMILAAERHWREKPAKDMWSILTITEDNPENNKDGLFMLCEDLQFIEEIISIAGEYGYTIETTADFDLSCKGNVRVMEGKFPFRIRM